MTRPSSNACWSPHVLAVKPVVKTRGLEFVDDYIQTLIVQQKRIFRTLHRCRGTFEGANKFDGLAEITLKPLDDAVSTNRERQVLTVLQSLPLLKTPPERTKAFRTC